MVSIEPIAKTFGSFTKAKPTKWLRDKWVKNPEGILGGVTVTSIILKDGIGCVMYVTQSLNNKKIPDEKRKFVAALDLTNGVLMIAAQIAMFFAMRKYSGPIFDKLFKKSFNVVSKENTISKLRMLEAKAGETVCKKLKIGKAYDKVRSDALGLFKFCADIAAATIIGKRVIVPLIATPLAKKVEARMNPEDKTLDENKDKTELLAEIEKLKTENAELKSGTSPSMQGVEPQLDILNTDDGDTNLIERYKHNIK